jgi:protein tyrosine phosphatase (PTP) superfamily phosphohydrolase (DUF442 family)
MALSPRLISGGEPTGEAGFHALRDLGVRTIVSVDAARPDVDSARRLGFRYVHIPMGYDGVDTVDAATMAKVLQECQSPIYIHCHHGKHRGPAMAAVALRLDTACSVDDAVRVLERAGTGKEYQGLWGDVRAFDARTLDGIEVTLHEVAPVGDLQREMAAVDRSWDRLKLCRQASWQTPAEHPDVSPVHEALLIEERLQELLRHSEVPVELLPGLTEAHTAAKSLHASLRQGSVDEVETYYTALARSCVQCHTAFRN